MTTRQRLRLVQICMYQHKCDRCQQHSDTYLYWGSSWRPSIFLRTKTTSAMIQCCSVVAVQGKGQTITKTMTAVYTDITFRTDLMPGLDKKEPVFCSISKALLYCCSVPQGGKRKRPGGARKEHPQKSINTFSQYWTDWPCLSATPWQGCFVHSGQAPSSVCNISSQSFSCADGVSQQDHDLGLGAVGMHCRKPELFCCCADLIWYDHSLLLISCLGMQCWLR